MDLGSIRCLGSIDEMDVIGCPVGSRVFNERSGEMIEKVSVGIWEDTGGRTYTDSMILPLFDSFDDWFIYSDFY